MLSQSKSFSFWNSVTIDGSNLLAATLNSSDEFIITARFHLSKYHIFYCSPNNIHSAFAVVDLIVIPLELT